MIYVVYKSRDRWTADSVQGFETEAKAIEYLETKPRTGIVGVFKGERLEPKIGETKVVKKTVTGFGVFTETKEEA